MKRTIFLPALFLLALSALNPTAASAQNAQRTSAGTTTQQPIRAMVFFRPGATTVDANHLDNLDAFLQLDREIQALGGRIDSVSIHACPAPDHAIARQRAQTLRDFLLRHYPDQDFGPITAYADAFDLAGLSARLAADPNLPYRDEVLPVTDHWATAPEATLRKLKALHHGEAFAYIQDRYLVRQDDGVTILLHTHTILQPLRLDLDEPDSGAAYGAASEGPTTDSRRSQYSSAARNHNGGSTSRANDDSKNKRANGRNEGAGSGSAANATRAEETDRTWRADTSNNASRSNESTVAARRSNAGSASNASRSNESTVAARRSNAGSANNAAWANSTGTASNAGWANSTGTASNAGWANSTGTASNAGWANSTGTASNAGWANSTGTASSTGTANSTGTASNAGWANSTGTASNAGWAQRPERPSRSVMAGLTTNLLLDAALAPNIGVTVPAGHQWSFQAAVALPWWEQIHNSFAYQILHVAVGARYWLRGWNERTNADPDLLHGWFLRSSVGGGYYDLAPWSEKGHQGYHLTASLGGGYAFSLGRNWRLDAFLALGPLWTRYDNYIESGNRLNLFRISEGSRLYPILPSAGITLTWLIPGRRLF